MGVEENFGTRQKDFWNCIELPLGFLGEGTMARKEKDAGETYIRKQKKKRGVNGAGNI